MSSLEVNELIVEVGRMCNLRCAHCLRGEAENTTVNTEEVEKLLSKVSHIDTIVFTGGEPTLYEKEICEIIDFIMKNEIDVAGFYIASNGLQVKPRLMLKLVEFRAYCIYHGADEEFGCRFEVSNDSFHKGYKENLEWFRGFSFFGMRNETNDSEILLISEGRAEGFGTKYLNKENGFSFERYESGDTEIELLYFNAEGYLLPHCDFSYKTQREMKPFKYGEKPLAEIIESYISPFKAR